MRGVITMSRLSMLVVVALAFASSETLAQLQAQQQSGEWEVKITGQDDQSLSGRLRLQAIGVEGDLGRYMIKPEKVKAIQFYSDEDQEKEDNDSAQLSSPYGAPAGTLRGTISATSGDEIQGTIQAGNWQVETSLGTLMLNLSKIKEIEFLHKAEEEEEEEEAEDKGDEEKNEEKTEAADDDNAKDNESS